MSTEPTSTTNITGLRIIVRGFELAERRRPMRRLTIAGSKIDFEPGALGCAPSAGAVLGGSVLNVAVIGVLTDDEVLDDGAERERREERQAGDDDDRRRGPDRRTAACRSGTCRRSPAPSACAASDPPMASAGMIRKKRPISIARPSVVLYHCVPVA